MASIIQELYHMIKEFTEKIDVISNNSRHQNNIMDGSFKIATSNNNGLTKHSQQIKTFLFRQNIDILLVSEKHFTNRSYYCIPEYTSLYHTMYTPEKPMKELFLL
jgi:hypothetical protein